MSCLVVLRAPKAQQLAADEVSDSVDY
eukprot:COSAG06_NODE_29249_length_560_cov_0.670282_1_plen_26_part_10